MTNVRLVAEIPGRTAADVYPVLCDFERYPELTSAVRQVRVDMRDRERAVSTWEVNFRKGVLRWTEEDRFSPDEHRIAFSQLEGDVDHFSGTWNLANRNGACRVHFDADFDMGIPSLRDIIEPIAADALDENIRAILTGLFGDRVTFLRKESA